MKLVIAIVVWAITATGVALALGVNVPELWALSRDPVTASGTVVRLDCDRRGGPAWYAYGVQDTDYEGVGIFGSRCSSLKAGDKVTVYYSASHPEISTNREPLSELRGELISIVLACLVLATVVSVFIFRNIQIRAPGETSSTRSSEPFERN